MDSEILKTFIVVSVLLGCGIGILVLGLRRPKYLWHTSVALVCMVNFSFFSGEIFNRIALPDILFITLFMCLIVRSIFVGPSISFPKIPLGIFALFFLTLILSYQSVAWERSIVLGEWQFTTFIVTSMIFFSSLYFIKEKRDLLLFFRAWSISSLITILTAFAGLPHLFKQVNQAALFDAGGFFGIHDLVSSELIKRSFLSEYGVRITGSFRTIGQLASYSLTSFFVMSAASFFPSIALREKIFYRCLAGLLVVCAIFTTRSSIYLSLVSGILCIGLLYIPKVNFRYVFFALLTLALVVFLSFMILSQYPVLYDQMINRRVMHFSNLFQGKGFFVEQIHHVMAVFSQHPWFGIGYGCFLQSSHHEFIRGHEIHSTILQLLAETGIVGFAAYLLMMGYFFVISFKLVKQGWDSPWRKVYLAFFLGYICMQPSYLYNRHLRERTFWLFVALIYGLWRLVEQPTRKVIPKAERAIEVAV